MSQTILSHVMERSVLDGPDAARLQPYYIRGRPRFATCSGVAWFPGPYLAEVNLYGSHLRIYRIYPENVAGDAAARLELLHEVAGAFGYSEDVAVSPDGAWLAVTRALDGRNLVTLYPVDPATMAPGDGIDIAEDPGPFHGICFSPDGRHLSFTNIGMPGYVDVMALLPAGAERACRVENTHLPLRPKGISFSHDGRFAAISTAQNATPQPGADSVFGALSIHRFDGDRGAIAAEPLAMLRQDRLEYCEMCTFLPSVSDRTYRVLVAMQGDDSVFAYDFDAGDRAVTHAGVFATGTPFPHGIRASADGRLVAVACYGDDAIRIIGTG